MRECLVVADAEPCGLTGHREVGRSRLGPAFLFEGVLADM